MKNIMKKMLVVLLAISMLLPVNVFAATSSPAKNSAQRFTGKVYSRTYTGDYQKAVLRIKNRKGTVLTEGKHFKVVGRKSFKNAGKHTVTIQGIGRYTGKKTFTYTIKKADQKVTVTTKRKNNTVKYSAAKKKTQKISLNVKRSENAKVTYKTFNKNVKVTSSGVVVLKKGIKKGNYKIVVNTEATDNYNAGRKVIYIHVK